MKMWHCRCKEMFTRLSYNDVRIRLIVIDDLIISRAYDPGKDNSVMIIEKNTTLEDQQMNIHVIIQVKKKNTRVRRNPVLFKSSSIFQRFD